MAPSAPSSSTAGPSTATGSIERISGVSFSKVVAGTNDRYTEYCAVGAPPIGLGSPGDVYIDKTPKHHVLYGFTTKWEHWNGPQKKKESDLFRHPKYPNIVLWATAGKRGWISLEVLKNRRQTDTENNILAEQMKADEKNKVTGTPFQADNVQRQPAPSAPQFSQSVGPAMVKSVPRETRRVSTGTASYPSPALSTWLAGLDDPSANESSPMLPAVFTESPMPQGTGISPMYPTPSPMPPSKSPMLVTDSPMSCTSSTPIAQPVPPSTPNNAPPHIDLAKINSSFSSSKSRTNASSSSIPKPSTPRQPGVSSPSTQAIPKSQRKVLGGPPGPQTARTGSSRPTPLSSTGPQRECPTSNLPGSTKKRKRTRSPISEAEAPLQTSPSSSSLSKMENIPMHDEGRSRPPKAVKTTHHTSCVVSPRKESASASRVTTQCSVERKASQPKKLPAVVIDLTLSDDDDDVPVPVLSPTALSPPQRESPAAPSPPPRVSPEVPSPPFKDFASSSITSPTCHILLWKMLPHRNQMCLWVIITSLKHWKLQYPESEESETAPLLPVDFSEDVTVYGTLGFKDTSHPCHIPGELR
ncbi:uncharacterized protein EV420DRAFT_662114 [Desarmillaria tabescens]|uniref:Uncharacterized protein n=1 Tax=Armillaria tabescens TaxID=1929756 RepID=A0AA39NK00_ARMTA|nr:uncharacterized protein EV420DRAFT_662114 [Desarmillaria tabescens]KAK0467043.1 hypothetical protein EV420DRAFT_662114 [Desarmillaria tabescens]